MVDQRANLDYGRDDETAASETTSPVEGDGFTMTDTDLDEPGTERPAADVDYDADDEDHNLEAETLGAP
jgi:hypothetical protein